jgi:hypothetical protein
MFDEHNVSTGDAYQHMMRMDIQQQIGNLSSKIVVETLGLEVNDPGLVANMNSLLATYTDSEMRAIARESTAGIGFPNDETANAVTVLLYMGLMSVKCTVERPNMMPMKP